MRLLTEIRLALRRLARRPALSLLAVALLAVGLGGNLALFASLDAMLFRQPPIVEPERLVRVVRTDSARSTYDNWSYPTADDLRRDATTLASGAIYADWRTFHLGLPGGENLRLRGGVVTADYFAVLGARAALGRLLVPTDELLAGGEPVVVLSYDLWRSRFASDPAVVGADLRLNGRTVRVVGVAPRGLSSLDPSMAPELWVPISTWTSLLDGDPESDLVVERGSSWLDLVARLAPGATVEAAQAELDARLARLAEEFPDSLMVETAEGAEPARVWVMPVDVARIGGPSEQPRVERQATLVAAIGLLALLTVAANLAALLTARAAQSRHETAVRAALGASRLRLALPLAVEGVLLVAAGTLLAVPLAASGAGLARNGLGFIVRLAGEPPVDLLSSPRLGAALVALVALALLVVAAAPALAASRLRLVPALRRESGGERRGRLPAADLLVVAQVGLSVVLLSIAGLLVGRFRELAGRETGLDLDGVVQAAYELDRQGYTAERAALFHDELLRRAEAAFGEDHVALTDWTPMYGGWSRTSIDPEGYLSAPGEIPNADVALVTPALFGALGIRLVAGRLPDERDVAGAPEVAVINETMARRYFPDGKPIGARFWRGSRRPENEPLTVVGVVADARYRDLGRDVMPMFFRPLAQDRRPRSLLYLIARSERPAEALARIRSIFAELEPNLPLVAARPLREQAADSIAEERRAAALFSGFAGLVLTLAAAGLGALALAAVARRRREIGVRVALGAGPRGVLGLLLLRIAVLVAAGAVAGFVVAGLVLSRFGELAGAEARLDIGSAVAATGCLAAAALVATWLPARRALAIEPAEVLRSE